MKKRSIVVLLLTIVLMIGAVAPAMAAKTGAWEVNTEAGSYLTAGEKAVFKKAVKGLSGASFTPVFRLATQTVAGTNYAFLCTSTTVTAKPVSGWKVVFVNENLKGKCTVVESKNFNITRLKTRASVYTQPSGDGVWTYNRKAVSPKGIPAGAKAAFNKAKVGYTGVDLTPLALLGTQPVSGVNYKLLCRGVTTTAKRAVCLYEVIVNRNAKGVCEITDCNVIDLPGYLKY